MSKFLKTAGIHHRLTTLHTPQQNGVAERRNRTLVETTRCMLIASGMPPSFWAEAILTANYIRNRCVTRSLSDGTPHEKWTARRPDVSHLRTFGSKVFILNKLPDKRKFNSRGIPGNFVGYSECSKAYRIWIPSYHKVRVSRDVTFLDQPMAQDSFEDFYRTETLPDPDPPSLTAVQPVNIKISINETVEPGFSNHVPDTLAKPQTPFPGFISNRP